MKGAEQMVSTQSILRLSRRVNVLLLISAFLGGQGALFAAQSYLIYRHAFELMVNFSLAFTMAVLGTLLVDNGGIILLARRTVNARDGADGDISQYYSALVLVRLGIWLLLVTAATVYFSVSLDANRYFFLPATFGLAFWCFNAAGTLDGLSLSGFSGLAAGIPFLSTAAVLPATLNLSLDMALLSSGIAFATGTCIAAVIQSILLTRAGIRLTICRPSRREVGNVFSESMRFQASFLPGQILFRGQLILADQLLSVHHAALFVYGKQAANAALQIVGFARRASFPELVRRCNILAGPSGIDILVIQWPSLVIAFVFAFLMAACAAFVTTQQPAWVADIGYAISIVSPVVVSSALFSAYGQSLQASGNFLMLATVTVVVLIFALCGAALLEPYLGAPGFIWAEFGAHTLGLILLLGVQSRGRGTKP